MTTLASDAIKAYAAAWDSGLDYASATLSGIVGDVAHSKGGGYHISIEDQPSSNNYSVVRPHDKAPPGWWSRKHASAVDMSMNTADMVKAWNRVFAVWVNHADPRRQYFNAINGWNGRGEAERLDFIANTRTVTTPDHKWHTHDETPREWYNNPFAFDAKLSVWAGEPMDAYIARTTGGGGVATVDTIYAILFKGGTDMGPAVPKSARVTTNNDDAYGNGLTELLQYVRSNTEKLLANMGKSSVVLSAQDLEALSTSVGTRVAEAVVNSNANTLTDEDLENVRSVAVSAAKQALREGSDEAEANAAG